MRSFIKLDAALFLSFTLLLMTPLFTFSPAIGLTTCKTTAINLPPNAPPPSLPPDCVMGINGLIAPPNMGQHQIHAGYFQLPFPKPPSGSYQSTSCANRSWGSKELVSVLYTVSEAWKKKYPNGLLKIGDLNASGHKSHKWGRAVDLDATTDGTDLAADFTKGNYNRDATIELGKMFVDTDHVLHIWYNDPAVNAAVLAHSNQTGKSKGMIMKPIVNHDNHFHVDVKQNPEKLGVWEPAC